MQRSGDIDALRAHLKALNAERLGVVLKIETRGAFERIAALSGLHMRAPGFAGGLLLTLVSFQRASTR